MANKLREENVFLSSFLNEEISKLLMAKKLGFEVFNALNIMDNVLQELKLGMEDDNLHYYLYNWEVG